MDLTHFTLLLDKLANDDEFRQALLADPKQALTSLGIDPQTAGLPEPLPELPPKEVLQKAYADPANLYKRYQSGSRPTGPQFFF
jgi:putative modified peptide